MMLVCLACSPGYFGPNCKQPCGRCIGGNNSCDIVTGRCDGGCTPGYIAPYCSQGKYVATVSLGVDIAAATDHPVASLDKANIAGIWFIICN